MFLPLLNEESFLQGDEGYRRHPWPQIDHINSEEITVQGSENNQTGFETPRMTPRKRSDESSSGDVEEDQEQNERIHHARMQGAVYVVGRSNVRSRKNASWLRRFFPTSVSLHCFPANWPLNDGMAYQRGITEIWHETLLRCLRNIYAEEPADLLSQEYVNLKF